LHFTPLPILPNTNIGPFLRLKVSDRPNTPFFYFLLLTRQFMGSFAILIGSSQPVRTGIAGAKFNFYLLPVCAVQAFGLQCGGKTASFDRSFVNATIGFGHSCGAFGYLPVTLYLDLGVNCRTFSLWNV